MISTLRLISIVLLGFLTRSHASSSVANQILGTKEPNNTIRIAAMPYKPFMSRNAKGQFIAGIEFKIIENFVEKENLQMSFEAYPIPFEYGQQISE